MTAEDLDLEWIRKVTGTDLASAVNRLIRRRYCMKDGKGRVVPLPQKKVRRVCICGAVVTMTTARYCHGCHQKFDRLGRRATTKPVPDSCLSWRPR